MSDPIVTLPSLPDLKERLKDPEWIKFYKKADIYKGSINSVNYLLKFFGRKTI